MPSIIPLPLLLALLTVISPLAVDMYLPAMLNMAQDLNTSIHWVELSISTYLMGFAIGQLAGGPLSDRFGRRPLILLGLSIFTLGSFFLANTDSLQALLIMRFFQALGGGLANVNASAIVRDRFSGGDVARMLSIVAMITMMAPLLAPFLGAFMLNMGGWRSIFYLLSLYGLLALFTLGLQLPETLNKDGRQYNGPWQDYLRIIKHSITLRLILVQSFAFSGMFIFITAASYLYLQHFGISPTLFPWVFGANVLVMMVMNRLNISLLYRYHSQQILTAGIALQALCALLLVCAFVFKPSVSLWWIMPFIMVSVGSVGLIAANATSLILHEFKDISATANALTGVIQYCLGALMGFIWSQLHNDTPLPMVGLMLLVAIISLALILSLPKQQLMRPSV